MGQPVSVQGTNYLHLSLLLVPHQEVEPLAVTVASILENLNKLHSAEGFGLNMGGGSCTRLLC